MDGIIIRLLKFSDDSQDNAENTIPYSKTDYLEVVDWSRSATVEGKKGFMPEQLPPMPQRLNMRPEQYLAYVRKPKYRFVSARGALDKLEACAEHFEKAFLKGQTAAFALFSPGLEPASSIQNRHMVSMPGSPCLESETFPAAPDNLTKKRLNIGKFSKFDHEAECGPVDSVS